MTHKAPPPRAHKAHKYDVTGPEAASGLDGIVAVLSPNSEATSASRTLSTWRLRWVPTPIIGRTGRMRWVCLQEEDGKRRPPAGGHSCGCGAAVGIPRKSQRFGLPRLEPEPGGPPFCGLGGRGLSQGSGPAPFLSLLSPFFVLVFPLGACRKSKQRPLPRPGGCWTSGSFPVAHPRCSPPSLSPRTHSCGWDGSVFEAWPSPRFPIFTRTSQFCARRVLEKTHISEWWVIACETGVNHVVSVMVVTCTLSMKGFF